MNYGCTSYSGAGYGAGGGYSQSQSYASSSASYCTGSYGPKPEYAMPEVPQISLNESFLAENRPWTPFISRLGDVQEVVEKTFELITGQEFPHDSIKIAICDEKEFRELHMNTGGIWSPGIMGFSLNNYGRGISEIYVRQDHMDGLLLTIGHELGHIL